MELVTMIATILLIFMFIYKQFIISAIVWMLMWPFDGMYGCVCICLTAWNAIALIHQYNHKI
jgi:hypothetical protein